MRGGYRDGAGRKRGFSAMTAEEARKVLAEMVMQEIVPIGEALIARAKNGEVPAIRELFDRAFGKAPQAERIESSERSLPTPILVRWLDDAAVPPIDSGQSTEARCDSVESAQ